LDQNQNSKNFEISHAFSLYFTLCFSLLILFFCYNLKIYLMKLDKKFNKKKFKVGIKKKLNMKGSII
jgi:hypothetical protein